jgi:hypothetical protein
MAVRLAIASRRFPIMADNVSHIRCGGDLVSGGSSPAEVWRSPNCQDLYFHLIHVITGNFSRMQFGFVPASATFAS